MAPRAPVHEKVKKEIHQHKSVSETMKHAVLEINKLGTVLKRD
jgi:hypothetical protein